MIKNIMTKYNIILLEKKKQKIQTLIDATNDMKLKNFDDKHETQIGKNILKINMLKEEIIKMTNKLELKDGKIQLAEKQPVPETKEEPLVEPVMETYDTPQPVEQTIQQPVMETYDGTQPELLHTRPQPEILHQQEQVAEPIDVSRIPKTDFEVFQKDIIAEEEPIVQEQQVQEQQVQEQQVQEQQVPEQQVPGEAAMSVKIDLVDNKRIEASVVVSKIDEFLNELNEAIADNKTFQIGNNVLNGRHVVIYTVE